jgi:hypothetical protein
LEFNPVQDYIFTCRLISVVIKIVGSVQGAVIGTKPCVPHPLGGRGKGVRGYRGAAGMEAYCPFIHVKSSIFQHQYFVASW